MEQKDSTDGLKKLVPAVQAPLTAASSQLTAAQIQALARIKAIVSTSTDGTGVQTLSSASKIMSTASVNSDVLSQAVNIIQRQTASSSGNVSSFGSVQQVVVKSSPLITTTVSTANTDHNASSSLKQQSGATIHHLGSRCLAGPMSNQNISSLVSTTMSNNTKQTAAGDSASGRLQPSSSSSGTLKDIKPVIPGLATLSGSPVGDGPLSKKIKLEEKPPVIKMSDLRQLVSNQRKKRMRALKSRYRDHLTELFYLQAGGNMVEYLTWKKRPTQPLLNFLEGSRLDSDCDEDILQEKRINDEVKVLTSTGSNVPVATPVAIATTLPPSVTALNQQAMHSSSITTSTVSSPSVTSSELQQHLIRSADSKSSHNVKNSSPNQPIAHKTIKAQSTSPGRARQAITSVYENVTGSQDVIVERAKQEAQVIQRVNELRKEGLWSAKRLPRVQEPPRQKAHWDYLLEEMTWLAADFIQERKWKKATSRKIARMISNHFREKEMKELKAEKEEALKLKKIASQMAKMVKEFWNNIEKVVQYKQTTRLEEKKKKALDLHLSFIVDQTEKYSSWLTAGLQSDGVSRTSSYGSDYDGKSDAEFQPQGTASDDEETIEKEENEGDNMDKTQEELDALQKESELPLEDLLKSLPKEMLEMPSAGVDLGEQSKEETKTGKDKDEDFDGEGEDDGDEEETLEEQEKHDKSYTEELDDLKAEGDMTVEELMKKYAGAYDSDFEMPNESSDGESSGDEEEEDESESEKETSESEEEEEEEEEEEDNKKTNSVEGSEAGKEAVGLEFLVKEETKEVPVVEEKVDEKGPGNEFNNIAAAAQSLQPKGNTLETTEVKTKVPFLIKHTLREYQHVGLDWLATMHEKRLNGILADEMGLGKTIQTIALLAHLACEKGIWGPHLIVVPTSVMLNWEMEIKKWCPAFKILTYYGSIKERKLKRQGWTKTNAFHICITSYKLVVQDHQAFRRKKWKYFILDEAQNIKNFKSQRWQMLLNFSSQRRLLLTGTPLQNSLMELWSLMHFLMPNVFQSHSEFKEWFSNPLTGMVEGSQEYNEGLIRRLHKVLRPFLLRRLKNEVEKQMPQKYEHVVMCRLSKRQRFLYDDFMAQSKTKETLQSGHFMSVINILMQLRKVCNHPNLFDPRPVISPFKTEGIIYRTASLVVNALRNNPFEDIDIRSAFPSLIDMETNLPLFVAERVKGLQAPRKLIEEIDSWPAEEPRPPVGQLKNLKFPPPTTLVTDSVAPSLNTRTPSTAIKATVAPTIQTSQASTTNSTVNNIKLLLSSSSSPSAQQSILIPNPNGSGPPIILPLPNSSTASGGATSVSSTSAAIAQAKLISSQLQSGLLHLVQTSSGQVITVASTSTSSSSSSSSTPLITTNATSSSLSSSSSNVSVLKLSSSSSSSSGSSQDKPVMKVTPFVVSSSSSDSPSPSPALPSKKPDSTPISKRINALSEIVSKKPVNRSELFLETLYRKKEERRRHILAHMAKINQHKCSATPVFGSDTCSNLNCFHELRSSNCSNAHSAHKTKTPEEVRWYGDGYTNCLFAQDRTTNHNHPCIFWRESKHLVNAVHSPGDHLKEMQEILQRFVFATPPVICPNIKLHISHPDHVNGAKLNILESQLKPVIHQQSLPLHPIQLRTMVQFPEPRLIQYDCGKLQTLDILLRKLKSGQHRVLIFTQMTKMLDVLEAFLNFHGHRYLRLDGTTKVEQRQFLMDRFNADARIFCFILSTRSGGVGVNLTGADTVVFYDSDWNPTMDAQAQDRCHRIGQTRDVHIYRLVSEMTVEENILKKANQKRLLGDLAIEGGNFTTAFFKQQTISDLFAEPSGLQSLVEAKEAAKAKESSKEAVNEQKMETEESNSADVTDVPDKTKKEKVKKKEDAKKESAVLNQFEQALSKAEDEQDVIAVKQVKAEQKAELAEFDETIPWDEREGDARREDEVSKVEIELAMLDKELTPIERYAVQIVEAQTEEETTEELKMAEEDIENSKKDWELARLKSLKEEEERKAELEDDEMLYIYSRDETQVKKDKGKKGQTKKVAKAKLNNSRISGSESDDSYVSPTKKACVKQTSPRIVAQKLVMKSANTSRVGNKLASGKAKICSGSKGKNAKDASPKGNAVKNKNNNNNVAAARKLEKERIKEENIKKAKLLSNAAKLAKEAKEALKLQKIEEKNKRLEEKQKKIEEKKKLMEEKMRLKEQKAKLIIGKSPIVTTLNGHSPPLQSKLTTQARNAILKKQALEAGHISITKGNVQIITSTTTTVTLSNSAAINANSSQPRLLTKPITPKSPDLNVPPPWSNPNLVIRTRKAAVHSPVVLSKVHNPIRTAIPGTFIQQNVQIPNRPAAPTTFIQQKVQLPTSIAVSSNVVSLQQGNTPERNIFQLFNTSPTGGIRLAPAIRHVSNSSSPNVNQIRTATLINPASIVNTVNLSGARFITPGMAGTPSSIISTGTTKATTINVGGHMSNIALVPTVVNPVRAQQTILTPRGTSTTSLIHTAEGRTVLNASRLSSPITLQGVGGNPVTVNLIKTSSGLATVPIRQQQLFQASSLAPISGGASGSYVLITPRHRLTTPTGGIATVQAAGSSIPNLQNARLVLAQVPTRATIIPQPKVATIINGLPNPAPTNPKKDV